MPLKILILGGYGVFGGRLGELIVDMEGFEILVAGRTLTKAKSYCKARKGSAAVFTPLQLDRADIANALQEHKPDIFIDASGPFQDYGDDPYRTVKACIAAKVHYLDLADAADFVFGIDQFSPDAKEAGITILSGVSSFPVLTAAVLRRLGEDMKVKTVTGGIAPSPYAGIGLNVMRAVTGYAGGPVKLTRGGKPFTAKGLTESRRYTVAPPGYKPLRNLRYSLVDVPDLQILPACDPDITDIWMGAGPVPESLHRVLNLLAKLRAAMRLPPLTPFAPFFYKVLNLMKFGEHRGGMFVEISGNQNGQSVTKSWHLLAEGDDGPYIPSMAIEAILRKWAAGETPEPGARSAAQALELEDYEDVFTSREIHSGFRQDNTPQETVFQTVLGDAFDKLAPQIRLLHSEKSPNQWTGEASASRSENILAKLIRAFAGLDVKPGKTPLTVTFNKSPGAENWTRDFDGRGFTSRFKLGQGENAHLLVETFGPISVALAVVFKDEKLHFIPRRWFLFGVPMPQFLLPREESFEYEKNGIFHFNVAVRVPLAGTIAAYEGWLKPENQRAPSAKASSSEKICASMSSPS